MDDKELIGKIREGHLRAFDLLYRKYSGSLMSYVRGFTQDASAAEDIFHEAFIQVIKNLNLEFRKAQFSTWLFKVARNLALNHLRDNRREQAGDLSAALTLRTPEQQVADVQLVSQVLAQLSPAQQEVFLLKQEEGFSYEEIAEILECPVGTVRSRLHYTVKAIRDLTEANPDELS